jgi:hypothetical protein
MLRRPGDVNIGDTTDKVMLPGCYPALAYAIGYDRTWPPVRSWEAEVSASMSHRSGLGRTTATAS